MDKWKQTAKKPNINKVFRIVPKVASSDSSPVMRWEAWLNFRHPNRFDVNIPTASGNLPTEGHGTRLPANRPMNPRWRCVEPERDSRPVERMRAELPPCSRTAACAPSSFEVLLASGRFGAGWAFSRLQLLGGVGCRGNIIQRCFHAIGRHIKERFKAIKFSGFAD